MPYGQRFPSMMPYIYKVFDKVMPEGLTVEEIVEKSKDEIELWLIK